jgi:hypothetical protein
VGGDGSKEVGEGTGLGLSVVHGLVTSYRGDLTIYSEPGRGTRVSVYIPVAEETIPEGAEVEDPPLPVAKGLRVLFVDDQPEVLGLAKRMLSVLGHVPSTAGGATEALIKALAAAT